MLLKIGFREKVQELFHRMWALGLDAIPFETLRTFERQKWLYGVGRTHDLGRKPVTWTMQSKHRSGRAIDIISKKHGWSDPKFFQTLHVEAKKLGLYWIPEEQCHIQQDAP